MERITSRENPQIKQLTKLIAQKKERTRTGLFVAEGARIAADAVKSGLAVEQLFLTPQARERYPQEAALLTEKAQQIYELTPELAQKIAKPNPPHGVFCVLPMLDNHFQTATIWGTGHYLVLCSLQDPGNLGTIIRSCEAFGIDRLFLTDDCPDLYSPKVLRATMGGVFRLPITVVDNLPGLFEKFWGEKVPVYAAALQEGAKDITQLPLNQGGAVVIGNEGKGLPPEVVALCDSAVIIPMAGRAESLNASVAASIVAWEMARP